MKHRSSRDMQHRAFSTIRVKKADVATRTIEGIATTPTPDRMGDVVEPKGAMFSLPIPLLWQHDSRKPVGYVTKAKVTNEGIAFTAKIESLDEPGTLKDRLDEAWHSVVKGLVRGVSIGFSSAEPPELLRNGGLRFLSWNWYELSLVTIPANAEATIAQIKSAYRSSRRAASKPTPAVAGNSRTAKGRAKMAKSTAERIKDTEDEITKLVALKNNLMKGAEEEERDLDDDEETEWDEADAKQLKLKKTLHRLKSLAGNDDDEVVDQPRGQLRVVKGNNRDDAARSRGGLIVPAQPKIVTEKGLGFARMVMCYAIAKGSFNDAVAVARQRYAADDPVNKALPLIAKAQVAGGSTYDPTWAGPLAEPQNLVSEFVEYLRPLTIIGKFGQGVIPGFRTVPFNIKVPVQISGGAADWVGEGKPKPLTKFDFNQLTLRFHKVAAIAVISEELLRHSTPSAEMLVRNSLAEACIERLDSDIVNPAVSAVSDKTPASLTNGAQTYTSFGFTADDVRADVKRLVTFFITNNISTAGLVFVMRQAQALSLSLMRNAMGVKEFPDMTMNGGLLEGIPVIASQYVGSGIVSAVCAPECYLADDGGVAVDMSREASLEMADDPTNAVTDGGSPPAPVETSMVSMFQTNSVAIRAERIIDWKKRRAAATAYQTGTGWGQPDTSPPQGAI